MQVAATDLAGRAPVDSGDTSRQIAGPLLVRLAMIHCHVAPPGRAIYAPSPRTTATQLA